MLRKVAPAEIAYILENSVNNTQPREIEQMLGNERLRELVEVREKSTSDAILDIFI